MNLLQKFLYFIIASILIISCNQVETLKADKPGDLLSREEMANILTELHVVEAIAGNENKIGDTATAITLNSYKAVYTKHHTTEEIFKKSFSYYKLQPVEIDSIYANVIEQLNAMEAKYDASNYRGELPNNDTIR